MKGILVIGAHPTLTPILPRFYRFFLRPRLGCQCRSDMEGTTEGNTKQRR
jgi:hypothetical protein